MDTIEEHKIYLLKPICSMKTVIQYIRLVGHVSYT